MWGVGWRGARLDQEAGQADLCWRAGSGFLPSKKSDVIEQHASPLSMYHSPSLQILARVCVSHSSAEATHHHDECVIHGRHSHSKPINLGMDGSGGLPALTIGSKFTASAQPPLFTHDNEEHTLYE